MKFINNHKLTFYLLLNCHYDLSTMNNGRGVCVWLCKSLKHAGSVDL